MLDCREKYQETYMFARRCVLGLSLFCLALSIAGCAASGLDSIKITPETQSLTAGQTAQFTVVGTYGNASHPSTQTITSGITWTSNNPSVATVSPSGVATALGAGTTTITATATAYNGPSSASAFLTVTSSGGGGIAGGSIASISVIPGSQSVASPNQTSQFIAIGTTSSGATVNLTNQVAWSSSSTPIATIGATTGLATAMGKGTSTITALYSNAGTVVTGTATFTVTGGTTQQFTALAITPGSQALSASGQTAQFIALGTSGSTGLQQDVTNSAQLKWSSSSPSIASIVSSGNTAGLATGLSAGNTTISAQLTNADGSLVSSTASVAVTLTTAPEPLLSLTIIPSTITVGDLQDTGQFLAIGTFSTVPYVRDLTNSPTLRWLSSFPNNFPVNTNSAGNSGATAGIVTAIASGSAVIIAEATSSDRTIQTATATFNCPLVLPNPPTTPGSCFARGGPGLLATITVYSQGLNTGNWLITAPSFTGTPNVIHCGSPDPTGGSVCVATYPVGATVTLTATGTTFGGWSVNCKQTAPITAIGPNSCTVTLTSDDTVGAIFN
jgi:uncharacterized protein YjdB